MGKVVLALDERLERQVAIKFIRPEHLCSQEARERFLQEARAMARVRSPHVIEIYTLGEAQDVPYLVMEYMPGCTLETRLAERPGQPLPLAEALGVLDQVCSGVEAIHASGTVHRDLKPGNILLGPHGRVAVADFGLARRVAGAPGHEATEIAGSPAYMAPEVIVSQSVPAELAARADVYALGVVAYRLFTGQLPFQASNAAAMLAMHVCEEPPPLRRLRPDLSADIEEVVLAALHKEPRARLPSAEALRQALGRVLPPQEGAPAAFHGERVLVVDDEADCARGVAAVLAAELPGAIVETANNGEQALQAIDAALPTLIISDLQMPLLNGFELLASLRGNERTQHIPVVVMTATGSGRDWQVMRRLGAEGFLVKPLDLEQMLSMVRAVLSRARSAAARGSGVRSAP